MTAPSSPPPSLSPKTVRVASYLVLLSLGLGLISLLPGIRPVEAGEAEAPAGLFPLLIGLSSALTVWLVLLTQRGRNDGRWGLLAYLALCWALGVPQIPRDFSLSPMAGVLDVVCTGLELVAAFHLFTGPGAAWFAAIASARRRR